MVGAGLLALAAGTGAGTAGVARAEGQADQPVIMAPDDPSLAATVSDSLARDKTLSRDNIDVSASNGVVTLTGNVSNDIERDRALRDAQHIAGVVAVRDNIMTIEQDY